MTAMSIGWRPTVLPATLCLPMGPRNLGHLLAGVAPETPCLLGCQGLRQTPS
jgi:hypothetical protein